VEFVWDQAPRHGVEPEEAEEAATDPRRAPFPAHSGAARPWDEFRSSSLSGGARLAGGNGRRRYARGEKSLPEVSAVKRPKFIPLRDPAEAPGLKTEAEARAFWDTHEVTAEYLERAGPVPDSELPPVRESSRRDLEARLKAAGP